jgi:predicted transcriptional regulator
MRNSTNTTAPGGSRYRTSDKLSDESEAIFFESLTESALNEPVDTFLVRIEDEDEARATMDRLFAGFEKRSKAKRTAKGRIVHSYPTLEHVRQFLTPQRQLLYRVLRRKQPGSVYELAKMLGRPYKAVFEDLKVLKEMNLIRLQTGIHNGRARSKPILTHKKLVIEFG